MNKILVLDSIGDDWTDRQLAAYGPDVTSFYRLVSLPLRVLRRLHFRAFGGRIPGKSIWYSCWKERIRQYDMVILFDAAIESDCFSWIRRENPSARIIYYYRNKIGIAGWIRPDVVRRTEPSVELWSFDKEDAQHYGMGYNPQFCFPIETEDMVTPRYDVVFVGCSDKRLALIASSYQRMKCMGLKTRICVLPSEHFTRTGDVADVIMNQPMPYEDILALNASSRAILEINRPGQVGLTNRALEAMMQRKKLITNNLTVEDCPIYDPANIFLIGKDPWEKLPQFLQTPCHAESFEQAKSYGVDAWLSRFEHGESNWNL